MEKSADRFTVFYLLDYYPACVADGFTMFRVEVQAMKKLGRQDAENVRARNAAFHKTTWGLAKTKQITTAKLTGHWLLSSS